MVQSGFNAIKISLASPDQIRAWSNGEVTKPETINYRTLRPEKDGLFCEKIFGPTKDWECYCGKYKKIRYRGVICDRCGVEVTRSKVRRERMGHIKLAAPVSHIWFAKGTPSRIGLLLDISPKNLERVIYFSQYIITSVNEDIKNEAINNLEQYRSSELLRLEEEKLNALKSLKESKEKQSSKITQNLDENFENLIAELDQETEQKINDINSIKKMDLLTESMFRELNDKANGVFTARMGAEAVKELLEKINLDELRDVLRQEILSASGQKRLRSIKRLRVVEAFRKGSNKPEWMIMTILPVLPPDLHPMVQLDGGRFATSDLNDLYRRVINRNNRLRHLLELQAPDIIIRNEKRMLQEAVDALIDNGRRGRPISGSHNHKLKSLSDLLRGKQGRFRQNLLGKRVDYSGRSVIISGPTLKLNECGLPRKMALELFKPFIMNSLISRGYALNIKSAKKMSESTMPEVQDILEEVIVNHPVLLNRAPTLHRLGIQAFNPVLVDGFAIQLHPLVCTAFNADFDGDQMAVHVPLSKEAIIEAKQLMMSTNNMLAPSSGFPIVSPTLDMVLGIYYLTSFETFVDKENNNFRSFSNPNDAKLALETKNVRIKEKIRIKLNSEWIETSVGRIIFNECLPIDDYRNITFNRGEIENIVAEVFNVLGTNATSKMLDEMKDIGFKYATQSGTTIAIRDIVTPSSKQSLLSNADQKIRNLDQQYLSGLITDSERYSASIDIWTDVSDKMTNAVNDNLPDYQGIHIMADSGAKGNLAQIKQMAGMRGLMSDPKGRIIEMPIRSSFAEGLSVLEYFISTHGARKGLADTALRTADSGYLTRRLADVAQDVIINDENDLNAQGFLIQDSEENSMQARISERIASRYPAEDIIHPNTGEILADQDTLITTEIAKKIQDAGIKECYVLSPLSSSRQKGISRKCYGASLATGENVMIGEAVGIMAAQSIGEPGTQLTMRTFHTGGIAGQDITSGLPRVVEIFEARIPRGCAVIADISGKAELQQSSEGRIVKIISSQSHEEAVEIPNQTHKQLVKTGEWVDAGQPIIGIKKTLSKSIIKTITENNSQEILAPFPGNVSISKGIVYIKWDELTEREYIIPAAAELLVSDGDQINAGNALCSGPLNPHDILRIKGAASLQRYMVDEVQAVYRSQGVKLHDKHIELIVRQMLKKVRIDHPGSSDLILGELVDANVFEIENQRIIKNGGTPATGSPILLGVTRASLNTDSFLSAASFQETARVLTEAAVTSSTDTLNGLKENVIIGRLIPARLDKSDEGRDRLGIDEISTGNLTGITRGPQTFEEAVAMMAGESSTSIENEQPSETTEINVSSEEAQKAALAMQDEIKEKDTDIEKLADAFFDSEEKTE